jgi:hypothetical protein
MVPNSSPSTELATTCDERGVMLLAFTLDHPWSSAIGPLRVFGRSRWAHSHANQVLVSVARPAPSESARPARAQAVTAKVSLPWTCQSGRA